MKTILTLLLIFSFSSLCSAKDKREPRESIRIIGVENSSPFSFTLPDGTTTGLYLEYWRLWSKSNNIPIEIVMQPFDVAMDTIKNKGAIIQGIFINDKRKQWADFSNPIHNLESGIIFSNKYAKDIKFSELSDAKVAVQAASYQESYIAKKYPSLNLVAYENTSEGIKKLLNNEVDAVVGEIPNLKVELTILRLDGVYTISDEVLLNNTVHAALAKGQPSLLKIIDDGINNIPIQSLIELEKKWLPSIKPFFSNNTFLTSLTMAERKWLQQLPSLRLGINSNGHPYEYVDDNGDFSGLSSDYIDHITKALSLKIEAEKNYSWVELLIAVKDNEIDVMSAIVRTQEREKSMLFTEPYFSSPTVLISRKNGFHADTLESLKGRAIGIPSRYALAEFIETDYPEITIIPVDSIADGLSKLNNNKFDAFISEISSANYTINKEKFADLIITGFSPYNLEVSMAVRAGLEPLVGILNKVFLSISEKEKAEIANNWLAVKVQTGIKLSTVVLWVLPISSFLMLIAILIFVRLNRKLKLEIIENAEHQSKLRESEIKFRNMFENADVSIWNEDMSDLKNALEKLRTSGVTDLYQYLKDHPQKTLEFAAKIKVINVNNATLEMFNVITESRFLEQIQSVFGPGSNEVFIKELCAIWDGEKIFRSEITYITQDGKHISAIISFYIPVSDEGFKSIPVSIVDITLQKQIEEKLKRAASVFTHTHEGIIITDGSGSITEVNDAFCSITGYAPEDVLGEHPRIFHSGRQSPEFYAEMSDTLLTQGYWHGEVWNCRKNGEIYLERLTISAEKNADGHLQHYVSLITDITLMKEHHEQLERMAHYDVLTNLPNRVLLADRLSQSIVQCQRRNQSLAVAFLDLDGFKAVNDRHGHNVGDELLVKVAQRMKEALRDGDTLARIGGDEFIAVMVDLENIADSEPVLKRLLKAAADPVTLGDAVMQVSASIGVSLYPQDDHVGADLLMRHADQAMYIAKQSGKNRYHIFDAAQDNANKTIAQSIGDINSALDRCEFVLHYQPKVNMRTGEVIGVEALIRWQHPVRGLVLPSEFLPAIEGHATSLELGEWVIDTALTQISQWRSIGVKLAISVNISANQLQEVNFTTRLADLLSAHPEVPPHCLELEILETSALHDISQVSATMNACHELGVRFALDDFGTGYSSLTYLKRLPAHLIKIDQSFVRDMLEDADDLAIVEGVVGLAKAFRRDVIAEGVETIAHGVALLQLGCELAQGYGIARPMPSGNIPEWVSNWKADDSWQAYKG
jgi:diguanylate cyclase (GGDEF)-like protein/PAS domain S-box-containing protein